MATPKAFNRFSTSKKVVQPKGLAPMADAKAKGAAAWKGASQLKGGTSTLKDYVSSTAAPEDTTLPPAGPRPTVSNDVTLGGGPSLASLSAKRADPNLDLSRKYVEEVLPERTAKAQADRGIMSRTDTVGPRTYEDSQLVGAGTRSGGTLISSSNAKQYDRVDPAQAARDSANSTLGYYKDENNRTVYRDSAGKVYTQSDPEYHAAAARDREAGFNVTADIKQGLPPSASPTTSTGTPVLAEGATRAGEGNRPGSTSAGTQSTNMSANGVAIGSTRQGLSGEGGGKDSSNYGFGNIRDMRDWNDTKLSDFAAQGLAEFGNEKGIWSLEIRNDETERRKRMEAEDPEKYARHMATMRALGIQETRGIKNGPLPPAAGVRTKAANGRDANVDMRSDYSWENKSATAIANDLLDMGGGTLDLSGKFEGWSVVDGKQVGNYTASEAARALNSLPDDIRRDVVGKLMEDGYMDRYTQWDENGVGNPLGDGWNNATAATVRGIQERDSGGYVNPSSPESFVLDKMIATDEYKIENGEMFEKGPHGEWVSMGSASVVADEIGSMIQAFTLEDGTFDSAGFTNESDARYNSSVISGVAEFNKSDLPESTKLASTGAVAGGTGGTGGTTGVDEVVAQWGETVKKLENLPKVNADDLIKENRSYYNMQNAKAMRVNMNRMARGGSSPEAMQGATAELNQQFNAAMAQQESQLRYQTEITNLQMEQNAIAAELDMFKNIYNRSEDKEMQAASLKAQEKLTALNNQANARAARLQMEFQAMMASGPSVLQQIGQAAIGVAGAVLGPWTGGASVVAAGAANAGISAASSAARNSSNQALMQSAPVGGGYTGDVRRPYTAGEETLPAMRFSDDIKYA